jgi:hypothetical protein
MKTNSINVNGCSVCEQGQESYTTFNPAHRPNSVYYQYDYRHTNNALFSCVDISLERCRTRRNEWLKTQK